MGAIVRKRAWIDNAAAGKGEARLTLEPGNLLDRAEPQWMRVGAEQSPEAAGEGQSWRRRAARQETGIEQAADILRRHRSVGDATGRRLDLDHRLEPIETARSRAHDLDWLAPAFACCGKRFCDLVSADGERAGIARDEQAGHRSASL